jgi:quercetin dioxygenase-like cupin family protein
MKPRPVLACVSLALVLAPPLGAQVAKPPAHAVLLPEALDWKPSPMLAAGALVAVLEGDPSAEGLFTLRIKLPAGYRIPPHWHPAYEHVTVISGAFHVGMGETFDTSKGTAVPAGGFSYMAPGMRHYAWTEKETIVQVHALGPWQLYYVDPADDPRPKTPAR